MAVARAAASVPPEADGAGCGHVGAVGAADLSPALRPQRAEAIEVWRLELAAEMLRANRFNMKEVGIAAGYANGSTFSRACHDWTGCTPKQLEARVLS